MFITLSASVRRFMELLPTVLLKKVQIAVKETQFVANYALFAYFCDSLSGAC